MVTKKLLPRFNIDICMYLLFFPFISCAGLPEIQMEDVDKIRLFANLLDNAIEAAESVPAQDIIGKCDLFFCCKIPLI